MKIIISTLIILTSLFSFAQNEVKKKEINFEVAGACDMCKSRIEESLDIKGIKFAEWDKESHNCKIIFDPRKISEDDIHSTIAEIGHDTDKVKPLMKNTMPYMDVVIISELEQLLIHTK